MFGYLSVMIMVTVLLGLRQGIKKVCCFTGIYHWTCRASELVLV